MSTTLAKAVDRAIAAQNAAFLADSAAQAEARRDGDRYRLIAALDALAAAYEDGDPDTCAEAVEETLQAWAQAKEGEAA